MSLFNFDTPGQRKPKTYAHVGKLPAYVDPKQPPTKQGPWRTINEVPFLQSVNIVLPEELYNVIWDSIEEQSKKARYAKVIMKLQDVLDGAFFTEYIKKGNVLMLSEGRPGVDNVFSLRDGVLRLELDKESYQRAGLQGQPISGGGRKHVKARYLIEIELRKPSMLHGKKGFERLVYAAKNVLNQSLIWLFCDLSTDGGRSGRSPVEQHCPTMVEGDPTYSIFQHALSPPFSQGFSDFTNQTMSNTLETEAVFEVVEWLGLVVLQSPRVLRDDDIDPYLSRYAAPESSTDATSLMTIRWHGLIGARWLTRMVNTCIRLSRVHHVQQWLAISASAHRTTAIGQHDGYSIILLPDESLSQEEAVDMETEPAQARAVTQETISKTGTGRSSSEKHYGGLQKSMCFEHVDSVVSS